MATRGMTPEQMTFISRLLGGQQGNVVSPLLPGGVMNPAGGLFTGGGRRTPALPPIQTDSPGTDPNRPRSPFVDTDGDGVMDSDDPDPRDPNIPAPQPSEEETLPDDKDIPQPVDEPPVEVDPEPPKPGEPEPDDDPRWRDSDGDGVPDAWDYYPQDPSRWEKPSGSTWPPPPHPPVDPGDPDKYPLPPPYPYPYPGTPGPTGPTGPAGPAGPAGAAGTGGSMAMGGDATISGFAPVFNIGNPAQKAVDVTMDAFDQYQKALMDKYYADTLRDLGMAALGGGSGAGREVVGPVGLFNRVTQGGGRYNQPVPFVKKERPRRPPWSPQNPKPVPDGPQRPWPNGGQNPSLMAGQPAAEGEPDGFDAAQFVSEVQADAGVPTDAQVAGRSFLPEIPEGGEEEVDWDKKDTKEFLEEEQGSGPIVHPGLQPRRLTLANPKALASLQQRPPEVEDPGPIYRSTPGARPGQTYNQPPQARHMGGHRPPLPIPPRPPWGQAPAAAADPLADQMASIMGGAGAPLGGKLAAQIEKTGQADEFQNLATAAQRGQDYAQAAYGLKGQERGLSQAQQQFRQQKAQDIMSNLASKMGQRGGPRTSVSIRG